MVLTVWYVCVRVRVRVRVCVCVTDITQNDGTCVHMHEETSTGMWYYVYMLVSSCGPSFYAGFARSSQLQFFHQ